MREERLLLPARRRSAVCIRAPVVEKILETQEGVQEEEEKKDDTVVAPSKAVSSGKSVGNVEVMARLPGRAKALNDKQTTARELGEEGDIVAVKQGNVFGTSFHPELTGDARIHVWWVKQVLQALQ
jgi:5'-phosphate synthase pdxT subunit